MPVNKNGKISHRNESISLGELHSLKEMIQLRFDELDKRLIITSEGQARALELAASNMDTKLESMNQFRQQLNAQAGSFATRDSVSEALKTAVIGTDMALKVAQTDIEKDRIRIRDLELWRSNIDGRIIMLAVGTPIASLVITLIVEFVIRRV